MIAERVIPKPRALRSTYRKADYYISIYFDQKLTAPPAVTTDPTLTENTVGRVDVSLAADLVGAKQNKKK